MTTITEATVEDAVLLQKLVLRELRVDVEGYMNHQWNGELG